jgi:hypothetical protein
MSDSSGRATRLEVNPLVNIPIRLPTAANSENGIRNFIEAISQSPCRVRAWFLRNASASSPAMPANTVDCHKWLANAEAK